MHVRAATLDDVPAWLALAREVEPLFGPMADEPDFRASLERGIDGGRAFCIDAREGAAGAPQCGPLCAPLCAPLCGIILISTRRNAVAWLAVASGCRGQGLGRALLAHAIAHLDPSREITVQTFVAGVPGGEPARALYRSFGFEERGPADPTPSGVPTVVMVRPAQP